MIMAVNGSNFFVSWSDFTQKPVRPNGVNEDAQIHPEMAFSNFKLARKGKSVIIADLDIDISLVAPDCWVVTKQMTNDLLKHEQGHYDILAISAKEFYNSVKGLSASSVDELQKAVTKKQAALAKSVALVDARYDAKTNHSQNVTEQKNWEKRIATELQKPDGSINNLP
jgi:hypothetical protein